ncbi:gamma-aminobutyric acid receptor alpha-like, partial [Limulus polyphemus]|uniref:Gamma-aminobutyric acid receptor alpha-like n=1 Tax=Limulus polyphemus TaxID=6850 RepID=A0ABM1RVF5_LIMPO
ILCFWPIPDRQSSVETEIINETLSSDKSSNISLVLNTLLENYDYNQRPDQGGQPTLITTNMLIRSIGPISEFAMEYSMDCYFRQKWRDERLQFEAPITSLSLNIKMLERIWKPDTYFHNGKGSYLHTITRPNKLLRIFQDGQVLYSMRLTIKAKCVMELQRFPMDHQSCPLIFGSYSYTSNEIIYRWDKDDAVSLIEGLVLSQFDLKDYPYRNTTVAFKPGVYSVLQVNFNLSRHMGYFLIQVYVPCILIVVLSWVSFWINREATADRVGLGITTVLTLSTFGVDTKTDLPRVSYPTALDWFVIMCFSFVVSTLLQFAGVHYFTKIGSGEFCGSLEDPGYHVTVTNDEELENKCRHRKSSIVVNPVPWKIVSKRKRLCCYQFSKCVVGSEQYREEMRSNVKGKDAANSVSKIDELSRILFPVSFAMLNLFYWCSYGVHENVESWKND